MKFETQEKENKCHIMCTIIIHSRENLKKKNNLDGMSTSYTYTQNNVRNNGKVAWKKV